MGSVSRGEERRARALGEVLCPSCWLQRGGSHGPHHVHRTTVGYGDDYDELCPVLASGSPDVVYRFAPQADVTVDIDTWGSQFDTKIYVYRDDFQLVACNGDYWSEGTSRIDALPLAASVKSFLVVDGLVEITGDAEEPAGLMELAPGECGNVAIVQASPIPRRGPGPRRRSPSRPAPGRQRRANSADRAGLAEQPASCRSASSSKRPLVRPLRSPAQERRKAVSLKENGLDRGSLQINGTGTSPWSRTPARPRPGPWRDRRATRARGARCPERYRRRRSRRSRTPDRRR